MQEIFKNITSAFGALWKCRPRGESLEVITPFPTSTDMYVSVFVTRRGDAWVATDGGWLMKGVYNCELPIDEKYYSKVFDFFVDDYCMKSAVSERGDKLYYKGTRDERLVPNIVFDVANFVSQTVSVALVQFRDQTQSERFSSQVKHFLRSNISEDRLKFNASLSEQLSGTHFNAVVALPESRKNSLVNIASGQTSANLKSSIARASFGLDFVDLSPVADKVSNRIVLIDDDRISFPAARIRDVLALCEHKNQRPVMWTDRERLLEILCA